MKYDANPTAPFMSRRQILLGSSFAATAALAQTLVPRTNLDLFGRTKLEALIPEKIGPWSFETASGLVVPPKDDLKDQLYSQVLTRVYSAPNLPSIMLLLAQSPVQNGILQLHRPEVCYPFGGYKLSPIIDHNIRIEPDTVVESRLLTASSADRTEQLLYWTRIGHSNPGTWWDERMAVAGANLKGIIPDGILVRISTIAPDRSVVSALDTFTQAMFASLRPPDRRMLFWY